MDFLILTLFYYIFLLCTSVFVIVCHGFRSDIKSNPYVKRAFCGIYPAIVVLILAAAFNLWKAAFKDKTGIAIAILSLIALIILDIHPILVILVSGIIGILINSKTTAQQGGNSK